MTSTSHHPEQPGVARPWPSISIRMGAGRSSHRAVAISTRDCRARRLFAERGVRRTRWPGRIRYARSMPTIGDLLAERYRLNAVIGRGGFASVFRARDLRLGRDVAVKLLRDDLAADPVIAER